jgi:hypothetical protein
MAWKKIIVSGSQAELNSLNVDNSVTANAFSGGGAGITGVVHNSGEIASDISGSFTSLSGSIASRFEALSTSYTDLQNIPSGIISSSNQIDDLFDIDGLVSSSAQVVSNLNNQDVNLGTGDITAVSGSFTSLSGDGSALTNLTVDQAATIASNFTNQTSVAVTHNFKSKNVTVTVYDSNDTLILPASVTLSSDNIATVTFDSSTSGRIVVAKGGHIVSGSISADNIDGLPSAVVSALPAGTVSGSTTSPSQGVVRLNGSDINLGLQSGDSPTFAAATTTGNINVGGNAIITGDLTVQGTTTSVQSTNLLVEDKFILLNSGSANPDIGGIVIDEGSGAGHALIYNNTAGRFGYTGSLASDASTATPDAFGVAVIDIDAGHNDISEYQKNGNIKTDSGTIFIYS